MSHKHKLYIRFRNEDMTDEVYRSPEFNSPVNLWESDEFDDLVVDGDDETGFCISCDMEGSDTNIVWLMFEPYDREWINTLFEVWNRVLGFALPPWDTWIKIGDIIEAYE